MPTRRPAPSLPGIAPPSWEPRFNRHVRLWHGTLATHAARMLESPFVRHSIGRPDTDFGRGFYTTTLEHQARQWAWLQHFRLPAAHRRRVGNLPTVLWFRVEWARLAELASLPLCVGDRSYDLYWSLVFRCRSSPAGAGREADHGRIDATGRRVGWYDLVSGPVAAMWRQRVAMPDTDQYSFHTPRGVSVFNDLLRNGKRGTDFDLLSVP